MNKNPTCESALTIDYTMEDVRQSILKAYEALRANPANLHQVRCAQQVLGKVTATAAQQLKYHKMTETAPTPALARFLTGEAKKTAESKTNGKKRESLTVGVLRYQFSRYAGQMAGELCRDLPKNRRALAILRDLTGVYGDLMDLLVK